MTRWAAPALLVASSGCGPTLLGSGAIAPSSASRALGCLEVTPAVASAPYERASSARVVYAMRNLCGDAIDLDFGRIDVRAAYGAGDEEALASSSAGTATLDGYDRAGEGLWYDPVTPSRGERPIAALCVDTARLVSDAPSERVEPVCFRREGDAFVIARGARAPLDALDAGGDEPGSVRATSTSFFGSRCESGRLGGRSFEWCDDDFARWGRHAPVTLTAGLTMRALDMRGRSIDASDPYPTLRTDALRSARAETVDLRATWHPVPALYVGGELGVGGAQLAQGAKLSTAPDFTVTGSDAALALGVVAGVSTPRVGPLRASAEVFAGGWAVGLTEDAPACTGADGCGGGVAAWSIEPRGRLEAWLTPHVSVDAWAGVGALARGDASGGIAATLHLRSFDGAR